MISYYTIPPSAMLAPYVRFFWVLEGEIPNGQTYTHRTMADGCVEMVFHYRGVFNELLENGREERSFSAGIDGPSRRFSRFAIHESFGIFGVYLFPFAVPRLFNIPASALSNQAVDLKSLLGQQVTALEERVMLAADNHHRARILVRFLEGCLHKLQTPEHTHVFAAIQEVIRTRGLVNIGSLAAQACLSTRQFERSFKQFAGFTPKLYSRIIRFQSALEAFGQQHKSLTTIAYDCGYYDQSHFIHDFREFSGFHPGQYFSGGSEATAWRE